MDNDYGFIKGRRDTFSLNGHRIRVSTNDAHHTIKERLFVHFVLFCDRCSLESSARFRFPASHSEEWRVAVVKLFTLSRFRFRSCQ